MKFEGSAYADTMSLRLGRPLPWAGLGLILSGGLGECQVRPDEGGGEGEVHAALAANAAGHWRAATPSKRNWLEIEPCVN